RRGGERLHVGEAREEAQVVGNHGRHLRLLQHDLRDPHAVGRALALPGQVVPAVRGVPGEELGGERGGGAHGAPSTAAAAPARVPQTRAPASRPAPGPAPRRRQVRSQSWMSPLIVFRRTCPEPSPRVPESDCPTGPLWFTGAPKQLLMSPEKVETSKLKPPPGAAARTFRSPLTALMSRLAPWVSLPSKRTSPEVVRVRTERAVSRVSTSVPLTVLASRSPAPCSRCTSPLTEVRCSRAVWPWPCTLTSPLTLLSS